MLMKAGECKLLYEEATRCVICKSTGNYMGFEDINGLPWSEVDFASDSERTQREVYPRQIPDSYQNAT